MCLANSGVSNVSPAILWSPSNIAQVRQWLDAADGKCDYKLNVWDNPFTTFTVEFASSRWCLLFELDCMPKLDVL